MTDDYSTALALFLATFATYSAPTIEQIKDRYGIVDDAPEGDGLIAEFCDWEPETVLVG